MKAWSVWSSIKEWPHQGWLTEYESGIHPEMETFSNVDKCFSWTLSYLFETLKLLEVAVREGMSKSAEAPTFSGTRKRGAQKEECMCMPVPVCVFMCGKGNNCISSSNRYSETNRARNDLAHQQIWSCPCGLFSDLFQKVPPLFHPQMPHMSPTGPALMPWNFQLGNLFLWACSKSPS